MVDSAENVEAHHHKISGIVFISKLLAHLHSLSTIHHSPTMNLDEQVKKLIDGAPDVESRKSVKEIAPILQQAAETLPQTAYYICQSPEGESVVTTLRHHRQPDLEIKVIYAFTRTEDISKFDGGSLATESAVEVPVIQLLFYLLAFSEIDRVVFLNNSQNLDIGKEISRQSLEDSIEQKLQQAPKSQLPPDVC
jgi:hypothetical protein